MSGREDFLDGDETTGADDDDLSKALRAEFDKLEAGDEDEDGGGFDAPLDDDDEKVSRAVSEEEGMRKIGDARDAGIRKREQATEPKAEGDEKSAPQDTKAETEGGEKEAEAGGEERPPEPLDDAGYAAEVAKLPASLKARVEADRTALSGFTSIFKGREAQLQGQTPQDAVRWLANVHDYAQRDPAGYAAWVVGETSGGDPAKLADILGRAAQAHGFKLVAADASAEGDDKSAEDDPFMSDREKALLEENRRLKAAQAQAATRAAPQYGPDSPQEQSRRNVAEVFGEVDASGNPLRPHFNMLSQGIVEIIKARVAMTGKPATREDLIAAYEQAELAHPQTREAAFERLAAAREAKRTSAANPAPSVQQGIEQQAAAVAKAKAASTKIIDGPGQGSGHQPADNDADDSIEAFLWKQMGKRS